MAERRFTVRIDAEMGIGQVKTAVQQMQAELSKLSLPQDMGSKISGTFSKLTNEIEKFQAMSAKGIGSTQDFNQLASSGNKIIQMYEQLTNQVKSLGNLSDSQLQKLFPPSILSNITKATNAMEQYQNSMKGSKGQISELEKEIDKAKNKTAQLVSQKEKLEKKTAVSDTTFAQLSKDAEEAKRKFEEAQAKLTELQNQAKQKVDAAGSSSLARKSSTYRGLVDNDIPAQEAEVAKLEQAWNRVENKKKKALSQSQKDEAIANLIKDIQKAEGNIEQLKNQLNQLKVGDGQSFQQLINQLNQINGIKLDPTTATIEDVQQAISKLSAVELEKLRNSFSGFGTSVESGRAPIQNFNSAIDETRSKVKQLDQTMGEVDMLKSRVNYFFGLTNSVFLFKRAITSALNTVKELDAVMTETAVVTDFSVGDMWEKLPEYSAEATKLGASIKDLYAATTLYYQQGLNTEAAMGVGIETMKMARIAGMDAADATQAMTAALRGFNMEVNEANATRVNDVYSELAAITAADTEQIATAMSKTASIASSANMEFETTSALLAQIIETTQEAPETAGTAMKTIIARFTEVKQLFDEGMLTGEDEEGEEININKIDAALKTVGISLKDFLNGSKGIDDIFLELASKWDTLDLATQRYIATMAAGSRQQSRFIAMMSNYERTMELVEAANNSTGASQQQFNKTLESMEAKLQKFSNAWNEFTMSLANNEILKGGVDLLTNLLETINNLSSAMSGGSGLLKSVTSLVTLIGALKLGKTAIGGGLGWIGSKMGMMNQGPIQETITTSVNDQGQTVNTIVRNPVQQGQQAGQQAGQGFVAGFKNAITSGKAGNNILEGFFTTGPAADVTGKNIGKKYKGQFTKTTKRRNEKIQTKNENLAGYNLKQKYSDPNVGASTARKDYLGEISDLNNKTLDTEQYKQVVDVYDEVYKKTGDVGQAIDAANSKVQSFGGTLMTTEQQAKMMGEQTNGLTLNMGALGGAAMGVGATLGLLTQLFESLGMEDAAKATSILAGVFMGLGTVMMTLSSIAPLLGMSFTTAGIQITSAGVTSQLAWWWVFVIIAAVVALTVAFVALGKAIYNASPAGQLEAATEAAEAMTESANNAREAYEDLKSSIDSLGEKYAAIDTLTKGTQEWRDAIAEINGEVLALTDKYPELAAFLESKDGVLQFNKEKTNAEGKTYDDVTAKYEQAVVNTQVAEAYSKAAVEEAQQKVDYQKYQMEVSRSSESTLGRGYYTDYSKTDEYGNGETIYFDTEEITNSLAQAMASGAVDFSFEDQASNEEAFAQYLQSMFNLPAAAAQKLAYELSRETEQLYNWGTSLNSSQEKIDGYNEMVIAQAREQVGLGGETGSMAENYITSDMVSEEVAARKAEIEKDGISEQEKIDYAEVSGYNYKDGKFYDAEGKEVEGITNEVIASGLATSKALDNLAIKMNKFAGSIDKINLKNLYKKEDGQGLTSKDFNKAGSKASEETGQYEINPADLKAQAEAMFNKTENGILTESAAALQQLYGSQEEFVSFYVDSMTKGMESYNKAIGQLSQFSAQDTFDGVELDSGAIANISKELYNAYISSGKDAAQGLSNSFQNILGELSPEDADRFAQALSMIDWNDTDSIEGLDEILTNLEFTGWGAIEDIEGLEDQIKEVGNASKKINLDNLRDEIKSVQDLQDDLEDRDETDRTFTKDEMELMVKGNPNLESEFVMSGIDEYVYVGDSINNLITALNQNTAALLGEYGEQVKGNAEKSQIWKSQEGQGAWTGGGLEGETTTIKVFEKIMGGTLTNVNRDALISAMQTFGMEEGRGDLNDYDFEALKAIITEDYNKYYGAGGNIAQSNIDTYDKWQQNEAQLAYSTSEKTNYSLLETAQGTSENQQYAANQIASEATGYSEVSDELAAYNALLDENGKLKDESQRATYEAALKEMKFATEIAKAKKEMREYGEKIDESLDGLEDIEEGTEDYKDALDNMAKQTNKYLDSDIDGAFLEQGNNLELLEDALEGDAEAWEQFNRNVMNATAEAMAANDDMVKQFGIDANEVASITAAMDALQFDVNGTADVSQLVNAFLAAGGTASEVAAYLEQLGLTNIELVADVAGADTLEGAINGNGGTVPIGSIKATNVRLAPSSFGGFTSGGGRAGGGGSGGGGGGSKEKWENPYDEFYNVIEDINEELRTREKLERRYQALLDKTGTKASDLVKNAQDQIKSLEKQKKLREGLLQGRNRQMSDIEAEYSDLSKYAWYNEEDRTIEIDWDKINALDGSTNEKLTSRIEEYISKLEEQQELIESEEDELDEIEETLREIRDQGKDEYFDLEAQIKEALIDSRQQEIDRLSEINDSINDTNSRLIDAMQSSIDKYRQDRENEETEEELADKQRQLAYLQQDTSGANALDIMQLQEEIDQAQEDYTDTLIDQKISELQEQNDEAAEQREKQISLMQAQLDKWTESGEIWGEVYRLMDAGMDDDGIKAGSELEALLMDAASFEGMSNLEKMKWLEELENNVAMAIQWLMVGNSTKGLLSTGQVKKDQSITFTTKDGKTVTGTVQEDGTVKTSTGEVYKDVYRSYDGKTFYTTEDYIEPTQQEPEEPEEPTTTEPTEKTIKVGGKINAKGAKIYGWPGGTGYTQYFKDDPIYKVLDIQGQYLKVRWHKRTSGTTGWFKKSDVKAYAQGGLADFTGPAWLDGTKSKPEYILNADQTKAFFELVDVLSGLNGIGQSSQITGDSIYDVDINIESIGSDYDVEQLAQTVKRMINDDARYRNNNAINLSR